MGTRALLLTVTSAVGTDIIVFCADQVLSQYSGNTTTGLNYLLCINQHYFGTSPVPQLVKNPPAMQETPVPFLGHEDPLEQG